MAWHDEHQAEELPTEEKMTSSSDTPRMTSQMIRLAFVDVEAAPAAREVNGEVPFVRDEPVTTPDGFGSSF
jgi:hypothetical protein